MSKLTFYNFFRISSSFPINFSFTSILSLCLFCFSFSAIFRLSKIACAMSLALRLLALPANIHIIQIFLSITISFARTSIQIVAKTLIQFTVCKLCADLRDTLIFTSEPSLPEVSEQVDKELVLASSDFKVINPVEEIVDKGIIDGFFQEDCPSTIQFIKYYILVLK